jgi:sRNA-binding regulator protein Hfq
LVDGIWLQGQADFFDNYIVPVKSTVTQLVYKQAISTIMPMGLNLYSRTSQAGTMQSQTL